MIAKSDVKTAGRTLDVFEAFRAIRKPRTLSELAALIGAPVSSCHGLVRTLRNRGYLYSVGDRNALYPTKRMLEMATVIAAHDPILEQIGPVLVALRDKTRETVILGKRQHDAIVYLEVVEGLHTIRYAAQPGKIVPLYSSAIGKTMLGQLTSATLAETLRGLKLARVTSKTITDRDTLAKDIACGRERGYFMTNGENVDDVMAIAAPIRAQSDWLGIAIAGPVARMERQLDQYLGRLRAACRQVERQKESA
jgi:IclR family transcriptional regulator, acetate operon repressor